MTTADERLYHARWAKIHATAAANELVQMGDQIEAAIADVTPDHLALASARGLVKDLERTHMQLLDLIKTLGQAVVASRSPASMPNACCGNPGTVVEGGKPHCATCGQEIT